MTLLSLLLWFGCVVTAVHGIRFMNANHPDSIPGDQVYVTHNDHTHQSLRHRRDIPGMPSKFTFNVQHGKNHMHFNLTRGKVHLTTPLYLVGTDGLPYLTEPLPAENLVYVNSGVYRSDNNDGVFMVQRSPGDHNNYILAGTFSLGLKEYTIKPGRKEEEQRGIHYLQDHDRMRRDTDGFSGISFRNDWRVDETLVKTRKTAIPEPTGGQPIAQNFTVEIFFFVDHFDYSKFVSNAAPEVVVTDDVLLFYAFVEECLNLIYGTIPETDTSFTVSIKTTGILIATAPGGNPWITNSIVDGIINTNPTIDDLIDYVKANAGTTIPTSDHYMSFTGGVLDGPAGVAVLGGACTTLGVSLVRNYFSGFTGVIAAHELGHSLDVYHDENEEFCNNTESNGNVMNQELNIPDSAARANNAFRFTNCSVSAIKSYLGDYSLGGCTYPENTQTAASVLQTNGQFAGQVFDADEQCRRLSNDTSRRFCRTCYGAISDEMFDRICWNMFCDTDEGVGVRVSVPFEKTSCGNGKWCDQGFCVTNANAPQRFASCPQGDDPTANCLTSECPTYTFEKRFLTCCASCAFDTSPLAVEAVTFRYVNLVCNP